jgi:hypothetical protein
MVLEEGGCDVFQGWYYTIQLKTEENHGKPQSGERSIPDIHMSPVLLSHQPAWRILNFYVNIA